MQVSILLKDIAVVQEAVEVSSSSFLVVARADGVYKITIETLTEWLNEELVKQ